MGITSEDVRRSLSNSRQLTFEITEDLHSLSLQDEPRPVALVKFTALFLGKEMEEKVTLPIQQC